MENSIWRYFLKESLFLKKLLCDYKILIFFIVNYYNTIQNVHILVHWFVFIGDVVSYLKNILRKYFYFNKNSLDLQI